MQGNDLSLLIETAHEAGRIAMGYWKNNPAYRDKANAGGPVSEADLAVDVALRERLLAARPDHGWLSEETEDDAARLTARRCFILDPIDGTRAFLAEEPAWAVSLAVAEAGRIVSAVVHLPARGETFAAALGEGATRDGRPITVGGASSPPRVLTTRSNLDPALWPGGTPEIDRHFRPSLAWRLALVAEGRFDAMLTLKDAWEWDVAAGTLIAAEAGARVSDRDGAPLVFNNPRPAVGGVLAAHPTLHADLMARLSPGRAVPPGAV